MNNIDHFAIQLFEEAKRFNEKAGKCIEYSDDYNANIHAAVTIGMCALEAFINSIALEMQSYDKHLPLYEQSVFAEKQIDLVDGQAVLSNRLKMYRIEDRIATLYFYYSKRSPQSEDWFKAIKQSISLRNKLSHPKDNLIISKLQAEQLLQSIMDTVDALYHTIYNAELPIKGYQLQSTLNF